MSCRRKLVNGGIGERRLQHRRERELRGEDERQLQACGAGETDIGFSLCQCGATTACGPVCSPNELCANGACFPCGGVGTAVTCGVSYSIPCPSGTPLEYMLECDGPSVPGTNLCVTCGMAPAPGRRELSAATPTSDQTPKPPLRRELRMMMKKKKSSKSTAVTPLPEMFTLLLNIPGQCTSTGTFTALSATVTCVTTMGTYTATASVDGFEPDGAKSSKGKCKGKGRS